MLTITRKDLLLTISDNVIPAMGSSDVPVKFVNDTETYVDFLIEPRVGYYVNGCPKSTVCEYDTTNNIIKIPAESFKNKGILVIAIALIDNKDSNHIEVTKELALEVTPAPNGTVVLPATDTWQTAVNNLVEQLYNQDYKPQFDEIEENLQNLVEKAQNQQNIANNQQTQIDNAIDIMGDYEIVQENPTQIRFKKGDGTYGDTVNLGDNLASKSMVNAGYDTYSGNSYSGSASDYGIEIAKASGNYEQVTTNGYQLFDASKLPTTTQGGATVTNNGDGSFTISGSGTLSSSYNNYFRFTNEETKKLIKTGKKLYLNNVFNLLPIAQVIIRSNENTAIKILEGTDGISSVDIAETEFDNGEYLEIRFYGGSGSSIKTGTIKPILYQDGDGTFEPFTGGEPAPNPNYPLEPKFFEPKEFVSVGKNCLDVSSADKFSIFNGTIDEEGYINIIADGKDYKRFFAKKSSVTLKPNTTYTFVIDVKENNLVGSGTQIYFGNSLTNGEQTYFKDVKKFEFSSPLTVGITKFKLTTKENFEDSNIMYGDRGLVSNTATSGSIKFRYAIYEGDLTNSDVGFEPFKGSDRTPLKVELIALPNGVKDTYENGVITRRIGEIEFDGSSDESFTVSNDVSSGFHRFGIAVNNYLYSSSSINVICDRFKVERYGGNGWLSYNYNVLIIPDVDKYFRFVVSDDITGGTLEGFKSWLQFNPIKVWYELATPITEKNELPIIPSYYPFTNAWHDSEVEASDLTWNILARQYGSGQTTIKKDEAVLTELDLNTERTAKPTTVKVQLKDTSGNVFYVETSPECVYLKGTDGSEISQKNLNDKIGQLINLVAFYSASPVSVLTDLKKYITSIT